MLSSSVIAFDLETVPDLGAVDRIHGLEGASDDELRARYVRRRWHGVHDPRHA